MVDYFLNRLYGNKVDQLFILELGNEIESDTSY